MPLLTNTTDLRTHNSAVQAEITFENLSSYRDDAEDKHIIPLIGQTFYDALIARVNDKVNNPLSATETELLRLLVKASANFTIGYYTSFGSVQLSNAGAHVFTSETMKIASDKKISDLKKQSFQRGYEALDGALNYLHSNKSDTTFSAYFNSDAYNTNITNFLVTRFDVNYIDQLKSNASLFYRLKPLQGLIIEDRIQPILGDLTLTNLQSARKEQTESATQKELSNKIRNAVSFLIVAAGIAQNMLHLDVNGTFAINESTGGITGNFQIKNTPDANALEKFKEMFDMKGESELSKIITYLNNNPTEFPDYLPLATDALSPTSLNEDNEGPIFFM